MVLPVQALAYPTTCRMLLPLSVEIFPHNNKKEGENAATAPWVQGIPNYSAIIPN